MKVIKIDGIRGILTAAFCLVCAFAGFIIFPGQVIAHLWNAHLVNSYMFPRIDLFQGVLLWLMIAISYFIVSSKRGFALSFQDAPFPEFPFGELPPLSDEDLQNIIKHAKKIPPNINPKSLLSGDNPFEITNKISKDVKPVEKERIEDSDKQEVSK